MSFAKITIVGHLGGDPESRYLESGKLVQRWFDRGAVDVSFGAEGEAG